MIKWITEGLTQKRLWLYIYGYHASFDPIKIKASH